ncbi:hypothetical protein U0070_015183, partial [Myodes glareolus]
MMTGYNNGRYPRNSLYSDCIIEDKTVVLQKKDNEGFGFVLRGAKADTPIEEFTPTPAFPALQYLESVDEGGVAWQAGLRTGDFLIEVEIMNRWISPANGVSTPRVTSTHVRHVEEDTLACPSEIALEAFTLPSMAAACGGYISLEFVC